MSITFTAPTAGSGWFKPADHDGNLILITKVHRLEQQYSEMAGKEITVAICDLVNLDTDKQLRENITVTHPGIVNGLRDGVTYVLGRIGQAPTKKGHPAWVLRAANVSPGSPDVAAAQTWVDAQAAGRFTTPAAAPATTAAAVDNNPTGLPAETLAALQALLPKQA